MNWYKIAQSIISYDEALKLLGLPSNYTAQDVKKSYRKLISKFHPDVNPDSQAQEITKKLNVSKELLLNALKKKEEENNGIQPPPQSKKSTIREQNERFFNANYEKIVEFIFTNEGVLKGLFENDVLKNKSVKFISGFSLNRYIDVLISALTSFAGENWIYSNFSELQNIISKLRSGFVNGSSVEELNLLAYFGLKKIGFQFSEKEKKKWIIF